MILTQYNDRQYGSRHFDQCKNYFAIRYDINKYELMKEKNHDDLFMIYVSYINTELILSVDYEKEKGENIYKIVYGHFYNDQNYFLFKKVHEGKIVGYKVNRCHSSELWHNKLNQLYISNYFSDVKKTAIMLNAEANEHVSDETTNPALSYIVYDKDSKTLAFMTLWKDAYDNETLEIIIENPYIIQPK